jgi:hypothetical protein
MHATTDSRARECLDFEGTLQLDERARLARRSDHNATAQVAHRGVRPVVAKGMNAARKYVVSKALEPTW